MNGMKGVNDWPDTMAEIVNQLPRLRAKKQILLQEGRENEAAEINEILVSATKVLATHNVSRMKVLLETIKEM
jgi:hypothetical protein